MADQHRREDKLQGEFAAGTLRRIGDPLDERQPLVEMGKGLGVRRALSRALAGRLPVGNGVFRKVSFGEVVREHLRLGCRDVRERLLERPGNSRVQRLPPIAQQCAVGGVLNEGVLEQIGRVRGDAISEQQPGLHQTVERRGQFRL